ncbi:MAG: YjgP/YjgQ family permease [Planctomycetaceae bacterium]|nr:YjgP/YjgQ family permease [Planctomycetaceae bacterium]
MRRITRYVVFELLSVFLVTLTAITSVLILAGVAKEGLREGLGVGPIMRMIPYVVPVALQVSVPATILMAASSVFGRMSADNEIVALKSLGISPMSIIYPALILAFFVSLVAVWINDIAVSWGRMGIYQVVVESVEEVAYNMLRTQRSYSSRLFSINVQDVDGDRLLRPMIEIRGTKDAPAISINATEAQLKSDTDENTLSILLTNGTIDMGDEWSVAFPDTYEQVIPLNDATRKGNKGDSPSVIQLRSIAQETVNQEAATDRFERRFATTAGFQMMTGDFIDLANERQWELRKKSMDGARDRLHRLRLEPWRRWANGFSCFFFVLLGAPLAIRMRTTNFFTTFAACFLPILLIYYPLLAFAVDRCKNGSVPPYTVWLGNLVLLVAGVLMTRKVIRY